MEDDFDLQGQLDSQLGADYNADLQDNSQFGADYLGGQTDWNFGNYGDQWAGYNQDFDPTFGLQQNQFQTMAPEGGWTGAEQGGGMMQGLPTDTNWNPNMSGGLQQTLAGLFSGQQGKALTSGLAALLEGSQNKKKASQLQALASQLQQTSDPFGSQRPFYQQQLQQTVQDPYSAPIVKSQVEQLARAQAIKDAAAGRRSNTATSNPALLAAQAQVAQQYMNSLMQPAGANIAPNQSAYANAALQGINAGSAGYASPLASALGFNQQSSNNTAVIDALKSFLAGSK